MDEARRGARVAARFRVAIEGLETTPFLRKGDISATGVYFETEQDVGEVGAVHALRLVSLDGAASVRVYAHVVRTLRMSDAAGRRISGAAFEFLPESDISAVLVRDFVKRVLAYRRPGDEPTVSPRLGARVGRGAGSTDATVQKLSVRSLVLETSWPIEPGEAVRVDVVAPGMTRRLRLDGRAVKVVSKAGSPRRYDIEVAVQHETKRPLRADSSMAIAAVRLDPKDVEEIVEPDPAGGEDDATRVLDDLLAALILPPEEEPKRPRRTHLSGELSRIPAADPLRPLRDGAHDGQAPPGDARRRVADVLLRRPHLRRRARRQGRDAARAHRQAARRRGRNVRVLRRERGPPRSGRDGDDGAAARFSRGKRTRRADLGR